MANTAGLPVGPALTAVELGATVVVSVTVTTPDDLGRVTLLDLSPGGLEPIDPHVGSGEDGDQFVGSACAFVHSGPVSRSSQLLWQTPQASGGTL